MATGRYRIKFNHFFHSGCGESVRTGSRFWSSWLWFSIAPLSQTPTRKSSRSKSARSAWKSRDVGWIWWKCVHDYQVYKRGAGIQRALLEYQQSSEMQGELFNQTTNYSICGLCLFISRTYSQKFLKKSWWDSLMNRTAWVDLISTM